MPSCYGKKSPKGQERYQRLQKRKEAERWRELEADECSRKVTQVQDIERGFEEQSFNVTREAANTLIEFPQQQFIHEQATQTDPLDHSQPNCTMISWSW